MFYSAKRVISDESSSSLNRQNKISTVLWIASHPSSPSKVPISPYDILIQHYHDFEQILSKIWASKLQITLEFLGMHNQERLVQQSQISAARRTIYSLSNSQAVFRRICASSPKARLYLEKTHERRRSVYFAVGLETLWETQIKQNNLKATSNGGNLTAPGELAVSAAVSVPVLLGEVLNISLDSIWEKQRQGCNQFFAEDE